ncbi:hypothetical protein FXO38_25892 [Capsicum annuum]|nr:hypothetical protein FXO37_27712 [Capsicum annuum]KAF3632885.1 hypothetical protein FXO38_25892 [Capsicum annuum]
MASGEGSPRAWGKVHKLMLLKEDLKKTSHKHKFEGLDEFLFKYSKVNKDFTQRRNLTKLLWANGYFVPRRKAYNPMDQRKEFPIKRVPTKRQKDQTYWSKLMHGRKGSCKASMEDKRTNSRCCLQVMYLPPPIPSDPWRHDDILLILNRPLRMIEIMPHHGSISVFMNPLWCLPLVFELCGAYNLNPIYLLLREESLTNPKLCFNALPDAPGLHHECPQSTRYFEAFPGGLLICHFKTLFFRQAPDLQFHHPILQAGGLGTFNSITLFFRKVPNLPFH